MNAFSEIIRSRPINCPRHGDQIEFFQSALDRWMGCAVCAKESIETQDAERHQADLASRRTLLRESIGLRDALANASMRDWIQTHPKQTEILKRLKNYALEDLKNIRSAKNLILLGSTGTGKTHLAASITLLATHQMIDARYVTSAQLLAEVRDSWGKKEISEMSVLDKYARASVLLIDEVGQRDDGQNAQEILSQLIDMRYKRYPTIITTNLTQEKLCERLGDRAYDRLNENLILIRCEWQSYREMQALANMECF